MAKQRVAVVVDGVRLVLTDKGTCKVCGEVVVYAQAAQMWFHVGRVKGQRYYDHQGRPRR